MNLYPLIPIWLLLLLLLLSAGDMYRAYRHRNPAVQPWQHRLLIALRAASLALVFFILLCPGRMTEERNLEKSHLVFLVDRSASMATRDLTGGQSRLEGAAAFLKNLPLKRLTDYPRAYYAFDSQTEPLPALPALDAVTPRGGTDFRQAVARVDKDIGLNRTAALVLVSDGIDLSGFKGSDIAVPILSVQTGTDLSKAKNVSIEPFPCPDKISEGEELNLEIPLLANGYETEQRVPFRVSVDGIPVHTATPVLRSSRPQIEAVKIPPGKTGIHILRLECETLPGEVATLDNRRELAVEVVTAKNEIAAYFPVLNNSFRPLLREFTKNEDDIFTAVYRVSGSAFRMMGRKMNTRFQEGLPKNADGLKNTTCLILGSHNGDLLSPSDTLVLERYVAEGGSLICLAGSDSFGKLPFGSPMLRLLPIVPLDDSFRPETFKIAPDPAVRDALTDQVRAILADNAGSPDLTLTGLNRVKDIKANATVELWAEGESRQPLLVWHRYGRGKVVALLSNALHQWGSPAKRDDNFGRFWRQLIDFSRRVDDASDLLTVTLDKTDTAPNESVPLTAVARHPDGRDTALTVKADVFPFDRDTPVASRTLEKTADRFTTVLPGLPAGRYVLRVTSQDAQETLRTRYKLLPVGADDRAEAITLRSNRDAFAAFSGERQIFTPEEATALEDRLIDTVRKNVVQRETFLIFESPLFFGALLLLLLSEWFLRRRFNLF